MNITTIDLLEFLPYYCMTSSHCAPVHIDDDAMTDGGMIELFGWHPTMQTMLRCGKACIDEIVAREKDDVFREHTETPAYLLSEAGVCTGWNQNAGCDELIHADKELFTEVMMV